MDANASAVLVQLVLYRSRGEKPNAWDYAEGCPSSAARDLPIATRARRHIIIIKPQHIVLASAALRLARRGEKRAWRAGGTEGSTTLRLILNVLYRLDRVDLDRVDRVDLRVIVLFFEDGSVIVSDGFA